MSEEEVWKPIKGYEHKYEVSNLGNVRSLDYNNTGTIKILKPQRRTHTGNDYLFVNFSGKMKFIHRLVAQAFIDNPNNKPCINHIDGNKQNNTLDNLEWCTYQENENHSRKVLKKKVNVNNYNKMKKERDLYKNIVDKAIEYIENDLQSFLYSVEYKTLLEILRGGENNR